MARRTRRALAALALLILVTIVAAVFFRQALLRGPVREEAEARLSAALGQPVAIGSLGVALFPRPSLTGSDVRVGAGNVLAPAVRLAGVRIIPRLWSIVRGPLVIDEVRLEGLAISVLRTRDGRWHVPAAVPVPDGGRPSSPSIARVLISNGQVRVFRETNDRQVHDSSSIDRIEAELVPGSGGVRLTAIRGRIGDAMVTGDARADAASVELKFDAPAVGSADLTPMLALLGAERPDFVALDATASMGVTVRIARATAVMSGTGVIKAPGVTVGALRLQHLEAPFRIDGSRLLFDPTAFTMYDGSHRGSVTVAFDAKPPRWSTDSRVEHLDLGSFLDALAGRDARIDGTARTDAALGGPIEVDVAGTMTGRAHLDVSDGVLHDFPLVAAVNRALRISGGNARDTKFARLSATLAIARGGASTSDLSLDAGEVRVAATGRIGFDRTLDLRGVATLSEARTAEAVASVHELARLRRNGTIDLPLTISGTLDTPAFAIDVKAAIQQGLTDELLRRLNRIIKD
ncbi:MAG TPA: AsmA-like C-terminal region-containing protein [Vicinamibacterales bacterium]